jgi:septal ring factor EnvC (AmiA/AmiB activator)
LAIYQNNKTKSIIDNLYLKIYTTTMIDKIKNGLGKPAGWMYFILVVALLIIVSNNSKDKTNLQAEIDSLTNDISTLETSLEASANEIAVRDDAIAGLNNAIAGWELDSATVNAKLNDSDALRGELESTVADLESQLNASASALEDAIANPNCPVTQ